MALPTEATGDLWRGPMCLVVEFLRLDDDDSEKDDIFGRDYSTHDNNTESVFYESILEAVILKDN